MSKRFLLVFSSILFLTIVCGGGAGIIAIIWGAQMSPSLAEYQEELLRLSTAGALAIITLLGSRGRK
jgi:hypothetical protein